MSELSVILAAVGIALAGVGGLFFRQPGVSVGWVALHTLSPATPSGTRLRQPGVWLTNVGLGGLAAGLLLPSLEVQESIRTHAGEKLGPAAWLADLAWVGLIVGASIVSAVASKIYGCRESVAAVLGAACGGVPALIAVVLLRESAPASSGQFTKLAVLFAFAAAVAVPFAVGTGRSPGRAPARRLATVVFAGLLWVVGTAALLTAGADRSEPCSQPLQVVALLAFVMAAPAAATAAVLLSGGACRPSSELRGGGRVAATAVGAGCLMASAGLAFFCACL